MPPRSTLPLVSLAAVFLSAATASAQTTITWGSASSGAWTTAANWSPTTVPNSSTLYNALISPTGAAYTVTADGAASLSVRKLDLTSSDARLVVDFSSTAYSFSLGSATSTLSAGTMELRTTNGLLGSGTANTTLTIGASGELLYSTNTGTRSLNSLTVNNSGLLHATSGVLSLSSTTLSNQSGGLVHADGAEIQFASNTTLTNAGTLRATGSSGALRFYNPITTANLGTVDLVSGGRAYLANTLTNTGATLTTPGTGASYELVNGRIVGGSVATGALKFTSSGGTLDGVTLLDPAVSLPANTSVTFENGSTFASGLTLNASSTLYWNQTGTLSGKTLSLAGANALIYLNVANASLTLASDTTATGTLNIRSDTSSTGTAISNAGQLTHNSANTGQLYARTFNNSGTITNSSTGGSLFIGNTTTGYNTNNTGSITVNGTNALIYLDGAVNNTGGTLTATVGTLEFRGANTNANLNGGTINIASGAHAYLNGTITNTGTLNAPTSGTYELYGGTISGGSVASGALTFTANGGTLNNVSLLDSTVSVPANANAVFTGGSTFGSGLTLNASTLLSWNQTGTLSGKTLSFIGANARLYLNTTNAALTLASDTAATGAVNIFSDTFSTGTALTNAGQVTHNSANTGQLFARTFDNSGTITNSSTGGSLFIGNTTSGYTTNNTGSITVNGTNALVYLDGAVNNTGGTLTATVGAFQFRGANTNANLNGGTINIASGAHAYLNGTITNTGTLNAPTSGMFELYGGTITGGSVASGALTFTSNGGTLNNVSVLDPAVSLPANANAVFTGGTTFGSGLTLNASTLLSWNQTGTLSGKTLSFLGANARLYLNATNAALTLASDTTASGAVNIFSDTFNTGTALTNAGQISHTSANTGQLYARTFDNSGTITNSSTSGSLFIGNTTSGYTTNNTGSITVNGTNALVYLDGAVNNTGGTLTATVGAFQFRGANTNANLNGGTINIASGAHAYLAGTITNTGTLNAPASGLFELYGGTISGGSVASGGLTFTNNGGTLNNVSLLDPALSVPASASVIFTGGSTFATALTLNANALLSWNQTGTLATKTLNFSGSNARIYLNAANASLTLASDTTGSGTLNIFSDTFNTGTAIANAGQLTHNSANTGQLFARTFDNSGTITNSSASGSLIIGSTTTGYSTNNTGSITVNGASAITYLDGAVNNNGGTLTATAGTFQFRGANTNANLNGGTINIASGAHAYLAGTITNTGTLNAPTSGSFELYGGTISGGSVASGGLTFTSSGGTLSNVSLLDTALTFPASTNAIFTGGSTFASALTLNTNSVLTWNQTGTLSGKTLTFSGANGRIYLNATNASLTLASDTTGSGVLNIYSDTFSTGTAISNAGQLTHTSASTGQLYARTFDNSGTITNSSTGGSLFIGNTTAGYDTNNTGAITVNGTNAIIYLDAGVNNTGGTLTATVGTLQFRGSNTNSNLNGGTINIASGAHAYLAGTITNTGTLNAPASGMFELYGGTITGGSVASGGLTFTNNGGTLSNVSLLDSAVNFPASTNAIFTGGSTFASGLTLNANSTLYWNQSGTLSGKTLTFNGSNSRIHLNAASASLTIASNTSASGTLNIYSDTFSASTAIVNHGSLTHTTGTGALYARSATNDGSIAVTGGTLNLGTTQAGYSFGNISGGSITVTGASSALQLSAPSGNQILNQGTLSVQSGTLFTNGILNNSTGGTLTGAGTINGNVVVSGGTVAPGNSGIGTFNFVTGAMNVTGTSVFSVDLGGASADKLSFQNPPSAVSLGSGLLTLTLNLLSIPTPGSTYNLLQITSGGSGITGWFSGLPNNGDIYTATFNSTSYFFAVNYQTNLVSLSLTSVPEPPMYALIAALAAALPILRRRRR